MAFKRSFHSACQGSNFSGSAFQAMLLRAILWSLYVIHRGRVDVARELPCALRAVNVGGEIVVGPVHVPAHDLGLRAVGERVLDRVGVQVLAAIGAVGRPAPQAERGDRATSP